MQTQKLKIAFLVCFMFFVFFTASTAGFTKPITFSLWRKNFELDEETMFFSQINPGMNNKTRNVDEEELGFGQVHETGSVASSSKIMYVSYKSCVFRYLIEKRI